jgi:hypothetical protein
MAALRCGLGALVTALLLLAASPGPASAQAGSKCSALKMKAAGAYLKAQSRCRAKTIQKGLPSDPVCLVNASDQLARAISKAERRGDCLTLEVDLPASTALVDAGEDVSQLIAPTCCVLLGPLCAWLSETDCLVQGGTAGAPGTVCSGTGTCVPPPAAPGACCEVAENFGIPERICLANITSAPACEASGSGGLHFDDAVCTPSHSCEAP